SNGSNGSGSPTPAGEPSNGGVTFTEGETAVAIDVVPSENEATVIGEVETCASASVGDRFIIDIVINDVEDLLAFEASVSYDGSILDIVDRDVKLFLASEEGSQVVDTSKQTPDGSGQYTTGGVDTADPLSPETGSGVLVRLTLEATADGTSEISLAGIDANADGKDDRGVFLRNVDGDIIGDDDDDTFFDGPVASAKIVAGESCEDSDARVVSASGGEGSGDDDGGGDALPYIIGGAVALGLIAAAGAGYLAYRRRRESGLMSDTPPSNEPPADGSSF
ncbi:MAG: cohesin domain-containing protein, partial [Dehalococcoidia bacterium]